MDVGDKVAAERAAFEAWHCSKFATKYSTGQPTRDMHNGVYAEKYGPEKQQLMWEAWQAARRTPSASTGEDGLPDDVQSELQEDFDELQEKYDVQNSQFWATSLKLQQAEEQIAYLRAQLARQSQGKPVYQVRLNGDDWHDIAAEKVDRWRVNFDVRTLYAAPPLSSEPQISAAPADRDQDPLFDMAVKTVRANNRASVSLVQRHLVIGYNRASRLMGAMAKAGVVSAEDYNGHRTVLPQGDA